MDENYDHDYHDFDNSSDNDSYDYSDYHSLCDKEAVRSFASLFLPAIYAVVLVVGLAGNALVVVVYASPRRMRTLTDACIFNLAGCDLILLLTLPFWAADAVHGWRLGVAACKIISFLYGTNFTCGMFLLAYISIDRYCALARSTVGRPGTAAHDRRRWLLMCMAVWVTASFLGVPDLVFYHVKHTSHRPGCMAIYPNWMARPAKAALELLEVTLSFLLPFLVMVVCYTRLGLVLSRAAGVRRERKWRALRVLLAVVAVFLLTQLPYNIVKLIRALDIIYMLVTDCELSKNLDRAIQVTESLALTHACINPILYAFIGSSFRGHVLRVAKRLGQRLGRHRQLVGQEPTVEIALRTPGHTHSQSTSEDKDTSTFTI
ncbi:atypical chemokine receptor 4b [Lampris incognitus]|uniref:atypical chemokine receptor 4b n=1 Tax=Lampris incognitus TaxID=2546036 RepID=UPI0024B53AE4|nr:atypical chemokine receptor 4b [Lampris incognitus]